MAAKQNESQTKKFLCGACKKQIIDASFPNCKQCKNSFHTEKTCSGLSLTEWEAKRKPAKGGWKCSSCRPQVANPGSNKGGKPPAAPTAPTNADLYKLLSKIDATTEDLTDSVDFLSDKYDFQVQEINSLKSESSAHGKKIHRLTIQNQALHKTVTELKDQLNEAQQYSRNKNVEVFGIEMRTGEDTWQVVDKLATLLHLSMDSIDVLHRLPLRTPRTESPGKKKGRTRHPSIVIQFVSRKSRDIWLQHRVTQLVSADIVGGSDKTKIFINEHLTAHIKSLHYITKEISAKFGFQFCWVKDGKIMVRKDPSSKISKITRQSDLDKIFPGGSCETKVKSLESPESEHDQRESACSSESNSNAE